MDAPLRAMGRRGSTPRIAATICRKSRVIARVAIVGKVRPMAAKGVQRPRAGRSRPIDPDVITISAVCSACFAVHDVPVDRNVPAAVALVGESCLFCGRLNALRASKVQRCG